MKQYKVSFNFDYYTKLASNTISEATFIVNEGSDNIQTYRDETGASAFYGNGSGSRRTGIIVQPSSAER